MKQELTNNSRSWMEHHYKVYSNRGKLLGEIQQMHLGFSATWGGEPTLYLASRKGWQVKACSTLQEAYNYLGISNKEVDAFYDLPW